MTDSETVDQSVDAPAEVPATAAAPAADAPPPAPKAARKKLADVAKDAAAAAPAEPAVKEESPSDEKEVAPPPAVVDAFAAAIAMAVLRASVGSDPRWDLLASKRIPAVTSAMREASNGDFSMQSLRNQYAIAAMEGMVTIPRTPVDVLAKRAYLAADAVIREQG